MSKKKNRQSNRLPQSNRQPQQVQTQVAEARIEAFSGPLPRPDILIQYEQVVPGAAERIIIMAEQQTRHRQAMERTVIEGDTKRAYLGLWVGGFVTLSVLGASMFLISKGHDWAGALIASLDIVGLASIFVYGTISRRRERVQKARQAND